MRRKKGENRIGTWQWDKVAFPGCIARAQSSQYIQVIAMKTRDCHRRSTAQRFKLCRR